MAKRVVLASFQFSNYCVIYQTQYMLVTHADALLCLQHNKVESDLFFNFQSFHFHSSVYLFPALMKMMQIKKLRQKMLYSKIP
jgi:hypothetical protein